MGLRDLEWKPLDNKCKLRRVTWLSSLNGCGDDGLFECEIGRSVSTSGSLHHLSPTSLWGTYAPLDVNFNSSVRLPRVRSSTTQALI